MIELLLILIVASALLWLWLSGYWFARIVATLALWLLFIMAGNPLRSAQGPDIPMTVAWLALCGLCAWCLASIPTWCKRLRSRLRVRPAA